MPKVKHIALLKFKEGTAPEQLEQIFEQMMDLSENIEGIEDYVAGPNNSPENQSDGFTHGLVMTFHDAPARDAFLAHADNERFKAVIAPHLEKMVVLDFEV